MKEKELIEKEISSHSSKLNNQRLNLILLEMDRANQACYRNPCLPNLEEYFSAVYTFFNNVWTVFEPEENEKIVRIFKEFFPIYFRVKLSEKASLNIIYYLIFLIDRANRLMKGFLQKKQFFFKIGVRKVSGIEESISIVEKGGAFFGGIKGVRRISENSNESKPKEH